MKKSKTTEIKEKGKKIETKTEALSPPKDSLSQILSKRKDISAQDFKPKVAVAGVGGGGNNTVNAVIDKKIDDVLTIAYNTDAQALEHSKAKIKMQLGPELTKGHGAGANPEVGKLAAIESEDEIKKHLEGVHVLFVVAGMGGGTGTGAGPQVARIALELGVLTIGVVTTPFAFEGSHREIAAKKGLEDFQNNCDVLIVVGNQNLFTLANEETTFLNAFELTDDVLCSGLKSFIQTIKQPSRINVDVSDFFAIMKGRKSRARMGTGFAEGLDRGIKAAQEAMASPLLELGGMMAKEVDGAIICIRCGKDMSLNEINQAVEHIRQSISDDAQIIFGATVDPTMENKVEIAVFATSSNLKKDFIQDDEEYHITTKAGTFEHEDISMSDFNDLIEKEDDKIGAPHSFSINENSNNSDFIIKNNSKPGFFRRILNFFFGEKKDEEPPFF